MQDYTLRELFRSLREGPYTSIGSYPKFWLAADGGVLSYEAVIQNIWTIARATRVNRREPAREWRIVAVDVNWENPELYCSDTGNRIQSAYAEPEWS